MSKDLSPQKAFATSVFISTVSLFIWGSALHIAVAAVLGHASLQVTLAQYATVLQWLMAA